MRSGTFVGALRRNALRIVALLAIVTLVACGSAARRNAAAPEPASPSPAELEAIYWARVDSARARFTHADARFVTGMIGHHAQAIVMARLAATNDAGQPVRVLAARIINAQEDEIALMQQWLRDRKLAVPEVHIVGTTLMLHGAGDAVHAFGMLSAAEIAGLERAHGVEFDRLFLQYMIRHHRGAVAMVRDLVQTDGAARDPMLFKLASDIQADQLAEIGRMQHLLAELSAGGRNP